MIKNNKPFTTENGWEDSKLISSRSMEEQTKILNWIKISIIPRKTVLRSESSYRLKHMLEKETGIYLTNNEFKDAMMIAGYNPVNPNALNWCYCISKKSPAVKNRKLVG